MYERCVYQTMDMIQDACHHITKIELRDLFAMNAMNAIINSHTNYNLDDITNDYKYPRRIPQ